jgi:hypothetical protein
VRDTSDDERENPYLAANMKRLMDGRGIGALRREMVESGYPIGTETIQRAVQGRLGNRLESLAKIAAFFKIELDELLQPSGLGAAVWPFSVELQEEVLKLGPEDLGFLELAMWSHLRKKPPESRHFESDRGDERKQKSKPATIDAYTPRIPSRKTGKRAA